jgi:hypothetical protein
MQGISRVIMSPTELKMQYPGLLCNCIVGCISNSVLLIITREILCVYNLTFIYIN